MEKRISIGEFCVNVQFLLFQNRTETKPIVVFLHEALGSIPQWKSFPMQLCEQNGLSGILIERSGHGKSDGLQESRDIDYLHKYAFETEQTLLELLPPKQPILFIGHSDGGSIALILGNSQRLNIQGIVTMAAHTFVEEETRAGIAPAVNAFEEGKLDGLYKIHGEKTKELFYAWANIWQNERFSSWDIRSEIESFDLPVLAIQGNNDQYGTTKQVDSIVGNKTNRQGTIINACGHHPHLEKTMETLQLIHHWYVSTFH